jgi:hypothetical protein
MSPGTAVLEPGFVFKQYASEESQLRQDYLEFDDTPASDERGRAVVGSLLKRSAALLELFAVAVCIFETSHELGTPSPHSSDKKYVQRVKQTCGLDIYEVMKEAREAFAMSPASSGAVKNPPLQAVVRAVRSLLEACPIEILERGGAILGFEQEAHRCRRAYEILRAFVLRNDEHEERRLQVIAQEYVRGILSVNDVAVLLGLNSTDAVWLLEKSGYYRPLNAIALTDEARAKQLMLIRQDRLTRQGKVELSSDQVLRDVLSSERIEGVDARPWLPRKTI